MNRSYRTIWNESLGAWVASSEVTAARGKKCRTRTLASSSALAAALAVTALIPSLASAASIQVGAGIGRCFKDTAQSTWTCDVTTDSGGTARIVGVPNDPNDPDKVNLDDVNTVIPALLGKRAILLGDMTTSASGENSIAIGSGASAHGRTAVAINGDVTYSGVAINGTATYGSLAINGTALEYSVALNGKAEGSQATAINAEAHGAASVAIGGVSSGTAYADGFGAITIGGKAVGTYTLALGYGASAKDDERSVALGAYSRAKVADGVALGYESVASTGAAVPGYVPTGASASQTAAVHATDGTLAAVSVGDAANKKFRQINAVAAGTQDSDAVNVAQLKAVQSQASAAATHYYSVNDGGVQGANYNNDGALGINSIAAGVDAAASAEGAVAIGKGASAAHANSVALGAGSQSTQAMSIASDSSLISTTTLSFAGATNVLGVVSVGGANGATRQIVNVAPGAITATSTDAVNGSQLFAVAKGLNDRIDAVPSTPGVPGPAGPQGSQGPKGDKGDTGAPGTNVGTPWVTGNVASFTAPSATGSESLAAGSGAKTAGSNATAVGNGAIATGNNTVALGQAATASGNGATALGQGSMAAGNNSVALGSHSSDAGRANVVSVGAEGAERQVTNVAPGTQGTDAVNLNQLNQMGNQLSNQIDVNRREANAGTAGAMAMAGMPQAYQPGKNMAAAGAATYRGETALAVGISRISDNGRWVSKFTGSANSRGQVGVSVGAGYQW